jgi:hypothetical protein
LVEVWKLADPRIALLVDPALRPARNLVIGKKRSEFANEPAAFQQTRALLWYLPPARSLILMPEDWTLAAMAPLAALCECCVAARASATRGSGPSVGLLDDLFIEPKLSHRIGSRSRIRWRRRSGVRSGAAEARPLVRYSRGATIKLGAVLERSESDYSV